MPSLTGHASSPHGNLNDMGAGIGTRVVAVCVEVETLRPVVWRGVLEKTRSHSNTALKKCYASQNKLSQITGRSTIFFSN